MQDLSAAKLPDASKATSDCGDASASASRSARKVRAAPTLRAVSSGRSSTSDALADLRDDARSLVSGNERLADDEASIPAFEVIVQIGAADAARAEPDQHLARSDLGFRLWLYAQVFLRVNTASQHDRSLLVTSLVQRQCFASQLLLKRLYALSRWPCIAARAPDTSCLPISSRTSRCSAIARVHLLGLS